MTETKSALFRDAMPEFEVQRQFSVRDVNIASQNKDYSRVEQLVARRAHNAKVGGASPPSATNFREGRLIRTLPLRGRNLGVSPSLPTNLRARSDREGNHAKQRGCATEGQGCDLFGIGCSTHPAPANSSSEVEVRILCFHHKVGAGRREMRRVDLRSCGEELTANAPATARAHVVPYGPPISHGYAASAGKRHAGAFGPLAQVERIGSLPRGVVVRFHRGPPISD